MEKPSMSVIKTMIDETQNVIVKGKIVEIPVRYINKNIEKLAWNGKGDWIDLRASEEYNLNVGDFQLIHLGIAMDLPEGYEAHIVPRSSTFKNWGILQTNSMGVIDNSYGGDNDQWSMPVYATRHTTIHVNDRVCQFRIEEKQPYIIFNPVEHLTKPDRGGFGSTGIN